MGAVVGAAQQRPQPRLQLAQRERLDQVVVGADVEPLHAVVDRVARGKHQNRRAVAGLAHPAGQLESVEAGHQDVEDDRVGGASREHVERLFAVGRELDLVVVELQGTLERPPDRGFVVDY